MDQILLCSNHIPLTTSINNSFIQNYMLDANGSYVKVYLYLSMCIQSGEKNLSISSLADKMENTEKDILRALRYWEKRGLMVLQRDVSGVTITGIEIINPDNLTQAKETRLPEQTITETDTPGQTTIEASTQNSAGQTSAKASAASQPVSASDEAAASGFENPLDEPAASTEIPKAELQEFTVTEEQTQRLAANEDFSWTCLIVESYLERPLKTTEVQLLTYLFDNLKFSKDLLLHLYEYCCSLGKTNVRYVQAVALSWAEHNITTPEQAKEHSLSYNTAHTAIAKSLALGRPLAKIERTYVDRWQNQWHMDLAVILEACNRTMLSIQKADFKYVDGILSKWHESNVHTLQDVHVCDEAHNRRKAQKQQTAAAVEKTASAKRTQFQAFQQRNTSREEIDELEKMLLTR